MLNMVNKDEKQANEDGKKTSGEIGLSGSMTRQVSLSPFRSPLRPRFRSRGYPPPLPRSVPVPASLAVSQSQEPLGSDPERGLQADTILIICSLLPLDLKYPLIS